jgi:hypothetical protein
MTDTDLPNESLAEKIRTYLKDNPEKSAADVVAHFEQEGVTIKPSYVRNIKSRAGLSKKTASEETSADKIVSNVKEEEIESTPKQRRVKKTKNTIVPKYPRHSLEKSLRIPKGILEQNAGRECTEKKGSSLCMTQLQH